MDLALSIATITPAKIITISVTVAFGNLNSERIVGLLRENDENVEPPYGPKILRTFSRIAPRSSPPVSRAKDNARANVLLFPSPLPLRRTPSSSRSHTPRGRRQDTDA